MSLLCLIIRLWLREYRLALSCDPHSAGVCVCLCVWRFPRVEGLHWDGLASFPLIAMQRGPAAYSRLWRLKYLPLCLTGTSWLTDPPPIPSLFLKLHPPPCCSFFSFFLRSSDWASYQHWLCVSYAGSVDNRLFEWHVLIQSHLNDICAPPPTSMSPTIKMSQTDLQLHRLPNKAYFRLGL